MNLKRWSVLGSVRGGNGAGGLRRQRGRAGGAGGLTVSGARGSSWPKGTHGNRPGGVVREGARRGEAREPGEAQAGARGEEARGLGAGAGGAAPLKQDEFPPRAAAPTSAQTWRGCTWREGPRR